MPFDREAILKRFFDRLATEAEARLDATRNKIDLAGMTPHGKFAAVAQAYRDAIRECLSEIPGRITTTLEGAKNKNVAKIRKFVLQEYKQLRESFVGMAESKLLGLSISLGYSATPEFALTQGLDDVEPEINLAVEKLKRSPWVRLETPVKVTSGVIAILGGGGLIGLGFMAAQKCTAPESASPNRAIATSSSSPSPESTPIDPTPSAIPSATSPIPPPKTAGSLLPKASSTPIPTPSTKGS